MTLKYYGVCKCGHYEDIHRRQLVTDSQTGFPIKYDVYECLFSEINGYCLCVKYDEEEINKTKGGGLHATNESKGRG